MDLFSDTNIWIFVDFFSPQNSFTSLTFVCSDSEVGLTHGCIVFIFFLHCRVSVIDLTSEHVCMLIDLKQALIYTTSHL